MAEGFKAEGRIIVDSKRRATENMALDEALLLSLKKGGPPTIRLYGWEPSAVSIGYFQRVEDEVDLQKAEDLGIDVVRRITGGGAVYHDTEGEVTYSVVLPKDFPYLPRDPLGIYRFICRGLISAFRELGFDATLQGVNDVSVGGRKISGSALVLRPWGILQHGTILISVDPERMFTVLKVPEEKLKDKIVKSVKERVTSLRNLGFGGGRGEVVAALISGFSEALSVSLEPSGVIPAEMEMAKALEVNRYGKKEWLFRGGRH